MFYKEFSDGIFVSNEHTVHYKLDVCPYCGDTDTLSHNKYTERCIPCGKLFNLYSVRRSARQRGKLTHKTATAHMALLVDLQRRREHGYKVPSTFDEEFTETSKIVDELKKQHDALLTKQAECRYCGAATTIPRSHKGPVRCKECEETFQQYLDLSSRIATLDKHGCDRLISIMIHYIYLSRRGVKVPKVEKFTHRINERMQELGGNRVIFYKGSDKLEDM